MIVIDDYVKDKTLLNKIKDNPVFLETGFMWWDGWGSSSSNTLKKHLIEYIWRNNPPCLYENIKGFEYWCNTLKKDQGLPVHFDKDEKVYQDHNKIVSPLVGCIYYPFDNHIKGGYLEIYHKGKNKEPERLMPKFNRLVVFDTGSCEHGVSTVDQGPRISIAINLWTKIPSGLEIDN
tara:strand:+ start:6891 stop:7421 length:531 start_codon:yes stop_codon:yes gene_type:complete